MPFALFVSVLSVTWASADTSGESAERTFHLQDALHHMGERQYLRYPKSRDYTRAYEREIPNTGQDISK